jgi:HK97 family phage portal protein
MTNYFGDDFDSSLTNLSLYSCSQYYELIKIIPAIYKSLFEIGNTCVAQKGEVFNKISNEPIEKVNDVIQDFLDQPAINNNKIELMKSFITDLLIAGECFAYFINGKDRRRPYIQRLSPCDVTVEGTTFDFGYYVDTEHGRQLLDKQFLIHLKYNPSTKSDIRGIGVIENNLELFKHARDIVFLRSNIIAKNAHITGVFSRDDDGGGIIEDDRTEKTLRAKYTGPKNVGFVFLPSKLKYHDIASSLDKLKLDDKLNGLSREIKAAFGLPRFLAEDGAVQGQKYNNHEKQLKHYLANIIAPLLQSMSIILTSGVERIVSGVGYRFILPKEIFTREEILKMVSTGMLTPNEGLKLQGLEKSEDENLNKHFFPSNVIPIDKLVTQEPEPKELQTEPKQNPPKTISNATPRKKSWRDTHEGGWISQPSAGVWTLDEYKNTENKKRMIKDFERLGKASIEKKSKEYTKDFSKFLAESYINILRALQKNNSVWTNEVTEKTKTNWIDKLFSIAESNSKLVPVLDKNHLATGAAAYSNVGSILTTEIPFGSISRPEVAGKINLLRKTAPLINQTTKEKLNAVLKASIEKSLTVPETAKAIMERFCDDNFKMTPEFKKIFAPGSPTHGASWDELMKQVMHTDKLMNRALVIARQETAVAYTEFSKQALIESGVVKGAQIVGCTQTDDNNSNTGCTKNIDSLELKHIQCSGVVVPCF